jgi:tetratricopeptide (TPR) repeat protein
MKRTILAILIVALAGLAGLLVYNAAARDRDYRQLIAQGDAALTADQTFQAIEAFSGAIALKPDSMIAHLKRGETYRRRGEFASALRDLRTAAAIDPTATRPLEQLGDINAALERYARAAESYQAYIRLDDRSPRVLYKLALALYQQGNSAGAIPALRQAVSLNNRFPEANYLMGLCLRDQRRIQEAISAFEQTVRLAPALVAPREALVELLAPLRRDHDVIAQLEALAVLDPSQPERHIAVGLAYARTGRTDMAVVALRRAAERAPNQPAVYLALGRVWLEAAEARGDRVALSKAKEALDGVVRGPSATSEALTLVGRVRLLSNDTAGAERAFLDATQQSPVDPGAFSYLAVAAERLGHVALARDAAIKAWALATNNRQLSEQATRAGELSLRMREPATAVVWFERALDASEEGTALTFARLAEAQLRARDRQAAARSVAKGLERDPRNRLLLDLRRRVQ